jgi:hypothetical protein
MHDSKTNVKDEHPVTVPSPSVLSCIYQLLSHVLEIATNVYARLLAVVKGVDEGKQGRVVGCPCAMVLSVIKFPGVGACAERS